MEEDLRALRSGAALDLAAALRLSARMDLPAAREVLDGEIEKMCSALRARRQLVDIPDLTFKPSECSLLVSSISIMNNQELLCDSFGDDSIASGISLGLGLAMASNAAALAAKAKMSSLTSKDSSVDSNISGGDATEDPGQARRNPFSSAKARFADEGGKFEPYKKPLTVGQVPSQAVGGAKGKADDAEPLPPELAHCDRALVERIESDIVHRGQSITFEDISGLKFAKECVIELICWPMTQPSLFQGLRALPRGLLLFGPPGTGKTLIGKAIAHQSGATFFSISASSLMSKWIGEGEKTVRALFAVAAYRQPAVIFIDEVDSLLCQRSSDENEATRRMKTEFMVQLDGASTNVDARVVIIGATNRPEELDEAVRRRFVKRIYIPLPDAQSRAELLHTLLKDINHDMKPGDISALVDQTDGFSGADIRSLCTEAAMGPIREVALQRRGNLQNVLAHDIPPITAQHFQTAFSSVKPSVSPGDLQRYIDWNSTYGSYHRIA